MLRTLAVGCLMASCGGDPVEPVQGDEIALSIVADGFSSPVHLTAPRGDDRLFVVEQSGRILIVQDGIVRSQPFLDIRDRVQSGGERGLLGLAFDPAFGATGRFYVNYTDRNGDTRIERFVVSPDPSVADSDGFVLLTQPQPFSNHNGGLLQFGPDGMLYVAFGDGGGAGDPLRAGQDPTTLLGSIIRIDVSGPGPYAVPAGNPFANPGAAGRPEIWGIGLRNPWRFDFDGATDQLFVADVGQSSWEEIHVVSASEPLVNFGWNTMEGPDCFGASSCNTDGLDLPAVWYGNGAEGCAIVGGHVYRGAAMPALAGHYFYSDLCGGWLRSFRYEGGEVTDPTGWSVGSLDNPVSFGEDGRGELYILAGSTIWQIVSPQ